MSTELQILLIFIVLVVVLVFFIVPQMKRRIGRTGRHYRRYERTYSASPGAVAPDVADIERRARNARPYRIEDIPTDTDRLTLFRRYSEFRYEGIAGAYLYPGVRSYEDCIGRNAPGPYYPHKLAIWSWDGDNRDLDNPGLQVEAKARFQQMLELLEQNGWKSTSHDDETTLVHFYPVKSDSDATT
jgi:hypothetical protein